jgi:hypothetical protein
LVPKERLLEWEIGDGWGPLCEFLGKPVPEVPFPHANARNGGWKEREEMANDRWIRKAFGRVILLVGAVMLLVVVWMVSRV